MLYHNLVSRALKIGENRGENERSFYFSAPVAENFFHSLVFRVPTTLDADETKRINRRIIMFSMDVACISLHPSIFRSAPRLSLSLLNGTLHHSYFILSVLKR